MKSVMSVKKQIFIISRLISYHVKRGNFAVLQNCYDSICEYLCLDTLSSKERSQLSSLRDSLLPYLQVLQ